MTSPKTGAQQNPAKRPHKETESRKTADTKVRAPGFPPKNTADAKTETTPDGRRKKENGMSAEHLQKTVSDCAGTPVQVRARKTADSVPRKIRLDRPLIVEGRYDKNTLSQVAAGVILPVGGFSVFHNDALVAYLRRLAEPDGLLILTDSDGGGGQIRRFLSSVLSKDKCTHLYIPQKEGKERRKKQRGKAGLLGVEGMPPEILRTLLSPYDKAGDAPQRPRLSLTKADLYAMKLSGHPDSAALRAKVAKALDLPADLTPDGFLQAVNTLILPDDFHAALRAAGLTPYAESKAE